jgi:glucoamylase
LLSTIRKENHENESLQAKGKIMASFRGDRMAFGAPGNPPRWARADKDGIGTAYSASSLLWYTVWNGIVTEMYYPNADRPQTRDLQYLFSDNETFFHQETRYLKTAIEPIGGGLGYRVSGSDPESRYRYTKEIISNPHLPCLLQRTHVDATPEMLKKLKLYALLAPHLEVGGWRNNGYVFEVLGRTGLAAERDGTWLVMGASVPFSRASVGYVGESDGWTDLANGFRMDWEFDRALDGNIALMGEIDLAATQDFTLGVAFGSSLHAAITTLLQSLVEPFKSQYERFEKQWKRVESSRRPLETFSGDDGKLYQASHRLLLAHEDKTFQGALVASLSIPWGQVKSDQEGEGGYHLVWTRDMVQSALGLLAAGNTQTPLRALIYLAASQHPDGSVGQNFWLEGKAFWTGIQLDEVSFPILLAHRLQAEGALQNFDPYRMAARAAGFLLRNGPVTQQERWEEGGGYSPSTMAAVIAALLCTADFARQRGDVDTAVFLEQYADWLEHNIETWMVTREGTLVPGVSTHYVRLNPACPGDFLPDDGVGEKLINVASQASGEQADFPARDIVDAGFLELVRYGIRRADDPIITDSLKVVDAILKVDLPSGPFWHRYNHDGYGERMDGEPYEGSGRGRVWPLLTGERGHYELAAGRDITQYVRAMEGASSPTQLIPEQIWDEEDRPEQHLLKGRATGSAMPLLWAHAEYIKLLRSRQEGKVYDLIPCVANRYLEHRPSYPNIQFWSFRSPAKTVQRGHTLRITALVDFRLRWSLDNWQSINDRDSTGTSLGLSYVDLHVNASAENHVPARFTFFWVGSGTWEGVDFEVTVNPS